jgi:hypothetical protein
MIQPPLLPNEHDRLPSGPGAAAIVAAGAGSLALGLLAFAGDASPRLKPVLSLWPPSGPLSGVSTAAILVWLAVWLILGRLWGRRDVNLAWANGAAFAMLAGGMLLTFPPFMDLLQRK